MKKVVKHFIRMTYEFLVFLKICKPMIIVRVDGGVCSQMHQYLLGFLFNKKGYKVKYDLTWYKEFGMDMNNKDVRNFDLLKAFPKLDFEVVNDISLNIYRHFYCYQGNYPQSNNKDWVNLTPPVLMSGYYADPENLYSVFFQEVFRIDTNVLDEANLIIYQKIDSSLSAAIHVRRGDLAIETVVSYGVPVSLDYFKKSIGYLRKEKQVCHFYLFSDDKKYLTDKMIPFVKLEESEYTIVQNGADKGYVDMILMSKCNYIVTSKGTLGKYAALLNLQKRRTVIVSSDDSQTFMLDVGKIDKIII